MKVSVRNDKRWVSSDPTNMSYCYFNIFRHSVTRKLSFEFAIVDNDRRIVVVIPQSMALSQAKTKIKTFQNLLLRSQALAKARNPVKIETSFKPSSISDIKLLTHIDPQVDTKLDCKAYVLISSRLVNPDDPPYLKLVDEVFLGLNEQLQETDEQKLLKYHAYELSSQLMVIITCIDKLFAKLKELE